MKRDSAVIAWKMMVSAYKCILLGGIIYMGFSQVNQMSGMAFEQVQIASGVTLQYTGNIDNTVKTRNEQSAGGWCGLGWQLSYPSIFVAHGNTVDILDDHWFYDDGYGNIVEIVRDEQSTPIVGVFYLRNSPQKKIEVSSDTTSGEGKVRILGWKIHQPDGSTMIFGYNPDDPDDDIPYLPCWNNCIGKGISGYPTPEKFYHRWPLRWIVQADGQTTKITYTHITGQTTAGFSYTKKSYPNRVDNPDGSAVGFTLAAKDKDPNEGSCEYLLSEFDFIETKFLRSISQFDVDGKKIEQVNFLYSGDPGQVSHIKSTSKGFAERLLTGIMFEHSKGSDRLFSYDAEGFLTEISTPETGTETRYTYNHDDALLRSSLLTDFESGKNTDRSVTKIGNHIFCYRYEAGKLEFEVYSKVGYEWRRSDIPGVTGKLSNDTSLLFPYNNRFIIHEKFGATNFVHMYEWKIDKWERIYMFETEMVPGSDYRIVNGSDYVVECKNSSGVNIAVHCRPEGENNWRKQLDVSYPTTEVPWQSVDVAPGGDYFVFAWSIKPPSEQMTERRVLVFRKDGKSWIQPAASDRVGWDYQLDNHQLTTLDDFYVVSYMATDTNGIETLNIAIRRWNPVTKSYQAEMLTGTNLQSEWGGFKWPRPAKLHISNDFIIVDEETSGNTWIMIYRCLKNADGSWSWKRTYIKEPSDASCNAVKDSRKTFGGQEYYYAKNFRNASGNPITIANIICSDRHFLVTSTTDNVLWDFRWEGNNEGPIDDGWISRMQGSSGGTDYNCQGMALSAPLYTQPVGVPPATPFPDYNAVIVQDSGVIKLVAYDYDFENGTYNETVVATDASSMIYARRFFPSSHGYCLLSETGTNPDDDQVLTIGDRYHRDYYYTETKTVERVSRLDELGYQIHTSFDYHSDNGGGTVRETKKNFFNTAGGYGVFNFSSSFTSDSSGTALTGKTTTEFCVDSSLGTFGQVYAVSQHRLNAPAQFDDDTVRINGFLMELDGYTPKVGWVCIGDTTTPVTSTKVPVNPVSGYFFVKMNNPGSPPGDFALYYFPTPDSSVYKKVFKVYTDIAFWRLDYPGNDGDFFTLSSNNRKEMNWSNVKINYGDNKTVWNRTRRSHAIDVTYNFYGKKKTYLQFTDRGYLVSPRSVRNVRINQSVQQITGTPFNSYNDVNNMPSLSYATNSDGSFLVSQTLFANEMYSPFTAPEEGMGTEGAHMLAQSAGKITYALPAASDTVWETANNTVLLPASSPFTYDLLTGSLNNLKEGDKIYIRIPVKLNAGSGVDDISMLVTCNGIVAAGKNVIMEDDQYAICSIVHVVGQNAITGLQLVISGVDLETYLHSIRCDVIKTVSVQNQDDRVVSASAVLWEPQDPGSKWRQKEQWVWKVPLDSTTGLPQETFEEFDYEEPDSNVGNHWEKKSTVDKYSAFSKQVQVTTAGKLIKTVMFGKNEHIPIAKAANTTFRECGVFTGDYQCREDQNRFWDKENGWEKGGTRPPTLETDNNHFGQKSIKVEKDFAASRNFLIEPGKAYTMTAWVKVTGGTGHIRMDGDFRYLINMNADWPLDWRTDLSPYNSSLPNIPEATAFSADSCNGKWRLMTMDIPAGLTRQLDADEKWYCRAWVGDDPGNSANDMFIAYVDDIRFAPSRAMVTSTFYDTLWRQPIVTIDENNNPGIKTVYDEYGRAVEFFRIIDKSDLSTAVRMQSKKYRLMGDGDTPGYTNGYETGSIDWSSGACGVTPSIFSGGHLSANCLQVEKLATCVAKKNIAPASFDSKMCVYRGYYMSTAALQAGAMADVPGTGYIGIGSSFLPDTTVWTPFEVYFDMRDITAGTASTIEFQFTNEDGGAATFYIDDETIQTMY